MSLFGFWHESGLLQGVAMEIYLAIHFRFYQESGLRRQQLATLTLIQENALECACCLQRYYPDTAREYTVATTVLSAELYSVCPVCGLSVADDLLDDSYRVRWRRAIRRQLSDTRHTLLMFLSLILSKRTPSTDDAFMKVLTQLQQLYPEKALAELKLLGDNALRYRNAACTEEQR